MRPLLAACAVGLTLQLGCGTKNASDAEARRDIGWLANHPTGEAIAALGRLADSEPRAVAALEARAAEDVNVYIAAWTAVTRGSAWGTSVLKSGLADPARAELAASAMARKDARLVAFLPDLDAALVRLAAGRTGTVLAGLVASIGPSAHGTVEKRLVDPRSRAAMCQGIALPEASADAKVTLLSVPAEARDAAACVAAVLALAATDDGTIAWLAGHAEPGLVGAAAQGTLPCPRLALLWSDALTERPREAALTVPLQRSIGRCAAALDPVLGEHLAKTPPARATIVTALDPYGTELAGLRATCAALKGGATGGESGVIRNRAAEALARGCTFAK